jgi:predicted adenylyl cyclase CyaB
MAIEIEVKVLGIDQDKIVSLLQEAKATEKPEQFIDDRIFDFPDKRFDAKKSQLRIRQKGDKSIMEFKSSTTGAETEGYHIADEIDFGISDVEKATELLLKLGFIQTKHRQKKRKQFVLADGCKVEIDVYPGIPNLLEVEGSKENIQKTLKMLGLVGKECSWPIARVMEHYEKDPNKIVFE